MSSPKDFFQNDALTSAKKVASINNETKDALNYSALEQLRQTLATPPKVLDNLFSDSEKGVYDAFPLYTPERITNEKLDILIENTEHNAELTAVMKDAILELAELTKATNEKNELAQKENALLSKKESRKTWLNIFIAFATLCVTVYSVLR